jgi:hypothetical protein
VEHTHKTRAEILLKINLKKSKLWSSKEFTEFSKNLSHYSGLTGYAASEDNVMVARLVQILVANKRYESHLCALDGKTFL